MGTRSGGNGGGQSPDGLPDLPPEWGIVVIPDDASELAQESLRVRRELRRESRQRRWRRRLHLPPPKPKPATDDEEEAPTLGVPLLVISIAVIATLVSLFAVAWPNTQQRPHLQPTAVATTPAEAPASRPVGVPPAAGTPSTGPAGVTTTAPAIPDAGAPPAAGTAPPPG
jgi:hypothetical protein